MKQENFDTSVDKWERIIKDLEASIVADIHSFCGFCAEFIDQSLNAIEENECNNCVLFPKFCSNTLSVGINANIVRNHEFEKRFKVKTRLKNNPIFWKIRDSILRDEFPRALELSKQMLAEIKKHDPKIKKEKII